MVAKKQTVSVSKSIINAIVSSGENGISVQELMDQYKWYQDNHICCYQFLKENEKRT